MLKYNVTTSICDNDTDNNPVSGNGDSQSVKKDPFPPWSSQCGGIYTHLRHGEQSAFILYLLMSGEARTVEPTWLSSERRVGFSWTTMTRESKSQTEQRQS